jgi:hypothetical protein
MLGSSIVVGIYNSIKNLINRCYLFIKNSPKWAAIQISSFKDYVNDAKYKLHHLRDTNIELGIEHLYKRNFNDAIIRFILVDKFFSKDDVEVNYWLGWAYFLKNNYAKSMHYLKLGSKFDVVKLGPFLENNSNYNEIPEGLWYQYRELVSSYYANNFIGPDNTNLYEVFVQKTLSQIKELPDNYSILELGSNIGNVGYEVRKRFPDSFNITGVEVSRSMNELTHIYYPNTQIYDKLIELTIKEFMNGVSEKFDVILSFCGFTFTKELSPYFDSVYSALNDLGFFAFCLPTDNITKISLKRIEYIFDQQDIKKSINDSKLILLSIDELSLGINKKYSIFVCRKIIGN